MQNIIPDETALMFIPVQTICFALTAGEAEKNLRTTPSSDCALNTLAIDEPLEYVRLYLDGNMQMWVDAEDSIRTMVIFRRCEIFSVNSDLL